MPFRDQNSLTRGVGLGPLIPERREEMSADNPEEEECRVTKIR